MRVAVIGAGPSGLVTLKYLITAHQYFPIEPIEALLFEAEPAIGGTFRYRSYEDAELVSSRQLTGFSDFRIPDNSPDFVSTEGYCDYLEKYCTRFGLWPHIRLSTRVERIGRSEKASHVVRYSKTGSDETIDWHCDAVAICSGLHVTPNVPVIPGIENVPKIMHSSEFKEKREFGIDQDVLILGCGETAMDLGYMAVTSSTKSVTLCHRSGWTNAPKKFPDPIRRGDVETWKKTNALYGPLPPTDCGSPSLFDTAYVHPMLEKSLLLWEYYDLFTKASAWVVSGTSAGLDQWVGGIPEERHHALKVIPNKSNNAMPYINAPYRPKVQTRRETRRSQRLSLPPIDTKGRQIDLAPWPERIDEEGIVHFQDTGRPESEGMKHVVCKPDLVIFATGYKQIFPYLDETYPRPEQADIRRIWKSGDESVAFIGFVRPNFGAIPPLSELQAQLWITNLLGRLPHPIHPVDGYRLRLGPERRIQYAVDHDSYAYQLALDLGSAPSALQVARFGPTVLLTWALGPNFNTKFRLIGPWRWSQGAAELMRTELWRVIARRRGYFIWTFLTVLPICIFGPLSLACFVVGGIWDVLWWIGGFVLGIPTRARPLRKGK